MIRIWISTSSFFNWAYNHKIINTEVKIVGKAKVKNQGASYIVHQYVSLKFSWRNSMNCFCNCMNYKKEKKKCGQGQMEDQGQKIFSWESDHYSVSYPIQVYSKLFCKVSLKLS